MARLTDEDLRYFAERIENKRANFKPDATWALKDVEAMVQEIRERRARDLSDEEREALRWLRFAFAREWYTAIEIAGSVERSEAALAVLDKLLERT